MKRLQTLLLGLLMLFFGYACTEDKEPETPPVDDELELSNPVISTPDAESTVDLATTTEVNITWEAATANTDAYAITYKVSLSVEGFEDLSLEIPTGNDGKDTELMVDVSAFDEYLMLNGVEPLAEINAQITVTATCLDLMTTDNVNVVVKRTDATPVASVEALYISGEASESGDDISVATSMKRLMDMGTGQLTNTFEVYTTLKAEGTYKFYAKNELPTVNFGGADGVLELAGTGLTVETEGQYRVFVDIDNMTYELTQITSWGLIGNPVKGWGEDVPLDYVGGGVWKGNFYFQNTENMIFRSNGDWGNYVGKKVTGSENAIFVGPDGQGGVEDLYPAGTGAYIVTLDLSGTETGYTYTMEVDENAVVSGPETLFILSNGQMISEFSPNEETEGIFNSKMIPLEAGVEYTLNSKVDGTGTSYAVSEVSFGEAGESDNVSGTLGIAEGDASFTVGHTQAYNFSFNFITNEVNWKYYNLKVFHSEWDPERNEGAGDWVWEPRDEFLMEYVHPLSYKVTAEFKEGFASKIYSPWEVVIGLPLNADQEALSGDIAENKSIEEEGKEPIHFMHTTTGTYELTIVLDDEYATGTYEFVAQ